VRLLWRDVGRGARPGIAALLPRVRARRWRRRSGGGMRRRRQIKQRLQRQQQGFLGSQAVARIALCRLRRDDRERQRRRPHLFCATCVFVCTKSLVVRRGRRRDVVLHVNVSYVNFADVLLPLLASSGRPLGANCFDRIFQIPLLKSPERKAAKIFQIFTRARGREEPGWAFSSLAY
jgi:hypothetical protein